MVEYIDKREGIAADLKAFKKVFDSVDIPWVIIGGIVLGYARYKEIMAWDTDVDIVLYDINDVKWQKLCRALKQEGFNFPANKVDFMYCYRRVECNIDIFYKDGNFYNSYPASTPGIKFVEAAKWFDEVQTVDFLGDKYPMPNHIEDFVVAHYGVDWKTNIIKDHEVYFTDKRGGRDQSTWTKSRASKFGDLWPKALNKGDFL